MEQITNKMPVIVVAAGNSSRMNGINKQFLMLDNVPVIIRTILAFEKCKSVSRIILVTKKDDVFALKSLCDDYKITKLSSVVAGGNTRHKSVMNGIAMLESTENNVLITDGARPFVTQKIIDDVASALESADCALACIKVNDTVKKADENGVILGTVDRANLYLAQTPQGVNVKKYISACGTLDVDLFTDDASIMEAAGYKTIICDGDRKNIKITEPCDISLAKSFVGSERKMRIGHGYDVHRLVENRKLIIGGVDIPYHQGLLGHSDADVLLHAICDSLLGAAALGDIGKHFPDTDDRFKGIDSLILLKETGNILRQSGFVVGNIDATVIAQAPKMAPYIEKMRENIANALSIDVSLVSVKATTEEKLGFTGNKEGISAHSICTVSSVL